MFLQISPFNKTFDEFGYTYFEPDFLKWQVKIWQVVEIPLWKNIENWIVLDIFEKLPEQLDIEKVKPIINIVISQEFLTIENILLAKFISSYYFTQIHNSINLFIPTWIRKKLEKLDCKFLEKLNSFSFGKRKLGSASTTLSQKQQEILEKIQKSKNNKILFYWITWSWKTEVYIKLIKEELEKQKQVLLLIPEIILNSQIAEKITKVFWEENVILLNSSVTEVKKTKAFLDIFSWIPKVVVWTRSSIFLPYKNLSLIIMDEEHDNSYNSDKSPRYRTKEILEKKSELNPDLKIILASWTPSVISMYKALKWEYELISLLEKY